MKKPPLVSLFALLGTSSFPSKALLKAAASPSRYEGRYFCVQAGVSAKAAPTWRNVNLPCAAAIFPSAWNPTPILGGQVLFGGVISGAPGLYESDNLIKNAVTGFGLGGAVLLQQDAVEILWNPTGRYKPWAATFWQCLESDISFRLKGWGCMRYIPLVVRPVSYYLGDKHTPIFSITPMLSPEWLGELIGFPLVVNGAAFISKDFSYRWSAFSFSLSVGLQNDAKNSWLLTQLVPNFVSSEALSGQVSNETGGVRPNKVPKGAGETKVGEQSSIAKQFPSEFQPSEKQTSSEGQPSIETLPVFEENVSMGNRPSAEEEPSVQTQTSSALLAPVIIEGQGLRHERQPSIAKVERPVRIVDQSSSQEGLSTEPLSSKSPSSIGTQSAPETEPSIEGPPSVKSPSGLEQPSLEEGVSRGIGLSFERAPSVQTQTSSALLAPVISEEQGLRRERLSSIGARSKVSIESESSSQEGLSTEPVLPKSPSSIGTQPAPESEASIEEQPSVEIPSVLEQPSLEGEVSTEIAPLFERAPSVQTQTSSALLAPVISEEQGLRRERLSSIGARSKVSIESESSSQEGLSTEPVLPKSPSSIGTQPAPESEASIEEQPSVEIPSVLEQPSLEGEVSTEIAPLFERAPSVQTQTSSALLAPVISEEQGLRRERLSSIGARSKVSIESESSSQEGLSTEPVLPKSPSSIGTQPAPESEASIEEQPSVEIPSVLEQPSLEGEVSTEIAPLFEREPSVQTQTSSVSIENEALSQGGLSTEEQGLLPEVEAQASSETHPPTEEQGLLPEVEAQASSEAQTALGGQISSEEQPSMCFNELIAIFSGEDFRQLIQGGAPEGRLSALKQLAEFLRSTKESQKLQWINAKGTKLQNQVRRMDCLTAIEEAFSEEEFDHPREITTEGEECIVYLNEIALQIMCLIVSDKNVSQEEYEAVSEFILGERFPSKFTGAFGFIHGAEYRVRFKNNRFQIALANLCSKLDKKLLARRIIGEYYILPYQCSRRFGLLPNYLEEFIRSGCYEFLTIILECLRKEPGYMAGRVADRIDYLLTKAYPLNSMNSMNEEGLKLRNLVNDTLKDTAPQITSGGEKPLKAPKIIHEFVRLEPGNAADLDNFLDQKKEELDEMASFLKDSDEFDRFNWMLDAFDGFDGCKPYYRKLRRTFLCKLWVNYLHPAEDASGDSASYREARQTLIHLHEIAISCIDFMLDDLIHEGAGEEVSEFFLGPRKYPDSSEDLEAATTRYKKGKEGMLYLAPSLPCWESKQFRTTLASICCKLDRSLLSKRCSGTDRFINALYEWNGFSSPGHFLNEVISGHGFDFLSTIFEHLYRNKGLYFVRRLIGPNLRLEEDEEHKEETARLMKILEAVRSAPVPPAETLIEIGKLEEAIKEFHKVSADGSANDAAVIKVVEEHSEEIAKLARFMESSTDSEWAHWVEINLSKDSDNRLRQVATMQHAFYAEWWQLGALTGQPANPLEEALVKELTYVKDLQYIALRVIEAILEDASKRVARSIKVFLLGRGKDEFSEDRRARREVIPPDKERFQKGREAILYQAPKMPCWERKLFRTALANTVLKLGGVLPRLIAGAYGDGSTWTQFYVLNGGSDFNNFLHQAIIYKGFDFLTLILEKFEHKEAYPSVNFQLLTGYLRGKLKSPPEDGTEEDKEDFRKLKETIERIIACCCRKEE